MVQFIKFCTFSKSMEHFQTTDINKRHLAQKLKEEEKLYQNRQLRGFQIYTIFMFLRIVQLNPK